MFISVASGYLSAEDKRQLWIIKMQSKWESEEDVWIETGVDEKINGLQEESRRGGGDL